MTQARTSVGDILRRWRKQRGLSQLRLAVGAGISQKHLSFIENGRAAPSRGMVLQLAEHLDVPLRECNAMLLAAGFAPIFRDRPLTDPALARALATIERLLKAHELAEWRPHLLERLRRQIRITGDRMLDACAS